MKITQHRRDVIVFSCTSDESCRRILYTLQTSQEVLADIVDLLSQCIIYFGHTIN